MCIRDRYTLCETDEHGIPGTLWLSQKEAHLNCLCCTPHLLLLACFLPPPACRPCHAACSVLTNLFEAQVTMACPLTFLLCITSNINTAADSALACVCLLVLHPSGSHTSAFNIYSLAASLLLLQQTLTSSSTCAARCFCQMQCKGTGPAVKTDPLIVCRVCLIYMIYKLW